MKDHIDKIKKQNWAFWSKLVITAIIGVITAMTIFFTSCNPIRIVAREDSTVQVENYQLKSNDVQEGNNNEIKITISPHRYLLDYRCGLVLIKKIYDWSNYR